MIYTRLYATSTNGACYTFGAPPVGTIGVQDGLKTPVYQIINELDIVPNMPHPMIGAVLGLCLKGIRIILKLFTVTASLLAKSTLDDKLEAHFDMLTRYRHPGYLSYLVAGGSDARLRYNLGMYDKFTLWFKARASGLSRFRKVVADHMIDVYVEKLKEHAKRRN